MPARVAVAQMLYLSDHFEPVSQNPHLAHIRSQLFTHKDLGKGGYQAKTGRGKLNTSLPSLCNFAVLQRTAVVSTPPLARKMHEAVSDESSPLRAASTAGGVNYKGEASQEELPEAAIAFFACSSSKPLFL